MSNNHANVGGGVYNGGRLIVVNSTFASNFADLGGGIFNSGSLFVVESTFFFNNATAVGGEGGAIFSDGFEVSVARSTFFANVADAGGAISGYAFTVANSTFSSNVAFVGGSAINSLDSLTLTNSTVSGNIASQRGAINGFHRAPVLKNTIVANNSGGNCWSEFAIADGGGNVSWPDTTCPGINQDPLLGPLSDNGGPTQTMALLPASPAIDAAVAATCPATDQRGVPRPQGDGCDIGAFEVVTVGIDIKPGAFPNSINVSKKGVIPVAVLGTPIFDSSTVDPSTVCFGDAENAAQRDCSVGRGTNLTDVNADGFLDLVLHFEAQETGIDPEDTQACLTAKLFDGTLIQGCDSIKAK